MESVDELATLLYNVSYHLVEIGRYVLNFMINRTWRDTFSEHQNGHLPDPDVCPFCRYEREVVQPRDANRAREALRHRRTHPSDGFDEVDSK